MISFISTMVALNNLGPGESKRSARGIDTASGKNWIEETGGRPMAAAATSATARQTPVFIGSPADEDRGHWNR